MAIRTGTGGLKYPLPANTDAAASMAAASAGGSASASAYGANRQFAANKMRVQADLANSAADRQFRAQEAYYDRGFRDYQAGQQRQHELDLQTASQDFRADQAQLDRDFTTERDMSQQDWRSQEAQIDRDFTTQRDQARVDQESAAFERQRDAGIEEGIRAGKLELSPEAQMRLKKIEADRAALAAANNLTPAQKAEFQKKADAAEREILRTARAPRGPTATEAANSGTTYFDPQSGRFEKDMGPGRTPGRVGKDGQFQPIVDQPDTSKEDAKQQKTQQDWLEKRADEYTKQTKADGTFYTLEEGIKKAQADRAVFDKAFGSQPPPTPGQPAPGATTPPPPVPLPGKPVGPTPTPQPLPSRPTDPVQAPVPLGMGNSVVARSGSDMPPAPADFPQGSRMLDADTVQLPDGRLLRRKVK